MFFVGIDTGGTFTDFFAIDSSGSPRHWKALSTPSDPSIAILNGLKQLFSDVSDPSGQIVHGTTVGTNAFLERKGAKTVFITTKGFEDILWIGRQARPDLYSFVGKRPPDIVCRKDVLGVDERMDFMGNIITPLDNLERVIAFCKGQEAQSVAVGFLHSYANPLHEQEIKKALSPLGLPVSLSSEVLPEFREFERFSTTVINAYLGPVVGNYVKELEKKLADWKIFIQQSHGGCRPAKSIGSQAVHTLLSGPAGGVQAAYQLGQELGMDNLITLDMGGTSTDVSLCAGSLTYTREYQIDGFPVAIPMIDIHTVGAGGGSIAWIDEGGVLQVGPKSAGADPGPVCYGKGEEITVTDANLFLGRLLPQAFLAGRMELYPDRIMPRLQNLASRLNLSLTDTALGIIKLVNINMVQALRAVSLEKGHDPRKFVLVCFGGAAGLHGVELAKELDIKQVLFPAMSGVFSAMGMAATDLTFRASMAAILKDREELGKIPELLKTITTKAKNNIKSLGLNPDHAEVYHYLDVRYKGQSFEITVRWSKDWQDVFEYEHERLYGFKVPDAAIETTAIRVELKLPRQIHYSLDFDNEATFGTDLPKFTEIIFEQGRQNSQVLQRKELLKNGSAKGPLLIIDDFSTILVPEGWVATPLNSHLLVKQAD